ncbi:MAG TPA: hypothetical protein VGD37_20735 [Kofleriaceae bacterium]
MLRRGAIALAIGWIGSGLGCGRVAFEVRSDAGGDDAASDAAPARIAYVAPFVQRSPGGGPTDAFRAQAHAAGNAVVIQVSCAGPAVPTGVSVSAPGWTFTQLGPITASTQSSERSATFGAIAPDAVRTAVSVSWTGSACGSSKNHLGDEFAMTDPAGGMITFDGVSATEGTGDCIGSVRSGHAGDVVWAACNSQGSVRATGAGFTKGADDGVGDWAEYRITGDPVGTVEAVEFTNDNVGYVLSMVTLKPQ